jgi:hypothetical protein
VTQKFDRKITDETCWTQQIEDKKGNRERKKRDGETDPR